MAYRCSNAETQETLKRVQDVILAFGKVGKDDCTTLKEYLSSLQEAEKRRLKWIGKSPQLSLREIIVSQMMSIGAREGFAPETVYLAIYLLDRFMDKFDLKAITLPYVGVACLVVAGKLLESGKNLRYSHYKKYVINDSGAFESRMKALVHCERSIVFNFKFKLMVPTEVSFLDVYLLYAVDGFHAFLDTVIDVNNNNNLGSMPNANYPMHVVAPIPEKSRLELAVRSNTVKKTAFTVLQQVARFGKVTDYPPSLIAAAVLMAARREHELNFWTPTLHWITSYCISDVYQCLWRYVEPSICKHTLRRPFTTPEFKHMGPHPHVANVAKSVISAGSSSMKPN